MNSIIPDKPFLSYDEQIERLRLKNIEFSDEAFVKTCLKSYSYYSLINGFKDLYDIKFDDVKELEVFPIGTSFSEIYNLFLLDSHLNSILFKYIIHVERGFKTKLSHIIAEKYGVIDDPTLNEQSYLNYKNYRSNGNLDRKNEISLILSQLKSKGKSASIDHYRNSHNHIPPWIAVNGILFGTVINWYKILKPTDKRNLANQYFTKFKNLNINDRLTLLPDMLTLLQKYRNNMAHGNRTFSTTILAELPKIELFKVVNDKILTEKEFSNGIGQKDLFSVIISIVLLLDDEILLAYFRYDLYVLFNRYREFKVSPKGNIYNTVNIPENIKERLNQLIDLFNNN